MELQETFEQVAQEFRAADASLEVVFGGPLAEEQVRSSLAGAGIEDDGFLLELYTAANGQLIETGVPPVLWDGFYFLPLERSLVERSFHIEAYSGLGLLSDMDDETPFGAHHWHRAWVPIGSDVAGNLICVSTAKMSPLAVNDLFVYVHDSDSNERYSGTFEHLLSTYLAEIRSGKLKFHSRDVGFVNR